MREAAARQRAAASGSTTSRNGNRWKVGVARVDGADAVVPHEDRRVRVVQEVAAQVGKLGEDLVRHGRVAVGVGRHAERRRREERIDEPPGLDGRPWTPQRPRMRHDANELGEERSAARGGWMRLAHWRAPRSSLDRPEDSS
jgi:hypothetical protein